MKKVFFLFLIFSFLKTYADSLLQDRQDLQRLLQERAVRFGSYTSSLKKRSGFFGNKTKGDMEKTNDVLIQIVATDNKIIDALNRTLNFKTFEKTNGSYETEQLKEKLTQSMFITDTLTRQLTRAETENKQLHSRLIKLKGLFYLSFVGLLTSLYFLYRTKKDKKISGDEPVIAEPY